jgi:ribokinase
MPTIRPVRSASGSHREVPSVVDVCVVGSFMADLVVRAPRRPAAGETVKGTSFATYLGGKGFNQAIAAARSGASTAMVGALGDDEHGLLFRSALALDGVAADGVLSIPDEGTGIAFPLVEDDGQNSIVIVPRANDALTPAHIEALRGVLGAAVVLLQLELPVPTVVAAAAAAKRAGATVILNPAPAVPSLADFAGLVDIVVPNEGEASLLTGQRVGLANAASVARTLCSDLGAWGAVITLGERGALVLDRGDVVHVEAHTVSAVDTVGAGDAFCGALAAELAAGATLIEAAHYANGAGALATTRAGAEPSMPTRAEIEGLVAPLDHSVPDERVS